MTELATTTDKNSQGLQFKCLYDPQKKIQRQFLTNVEQRRVADDEIDALLDEEKLEAIGINPSEIRFNLWSNGPHRLRATPVGWIKQTPKEIRKQQKQ